MSYYYSKRSNYILQTTHPDLQKLFNKVIKVIDCSIIYGIRTKYEQDELVRKGYSKLNYPLSKHNKIPSQAIDVAPYPVNWHDRERFIYFAGIVKGTASQLGISIRWGGDWDSDNDLRDQTFNDLAHFELISYK